METIFNMNFNRLLVLLRLHHTNRSARRQQLLYGQNDYEVQIKVTNLSMEDLKNLDTRFISINNGEICPSLYWRNYILENDDLIDKLFRSMISLNRRNRRTRYRHK